MGQRCCGNDGNLFCFDSMLNTFRAQKRENAREVQLRRMCKRVLACVSMMFMSHVVWPARFSRLRENELNASMMLTAC